MQTHRLFDVSIDDIDSKELNQKLETWVLSGNHIIFTPNAEMLLLANKAPWFKKVLSKSDLSIPDSVSIRYAVAALTEDKLKNRHTGVDTLQKIIKICQQKKRKIILLGGVSKIAKKAIENLKIDYPGLDIEMIETGYVSVDKTGNTQIAKDVIDKINLLKPSVLAVALGHGKQESLIVKHMQYMDFINVAIGVGGAIDMIAGEKRRAPKPLRQMGLEWFWRVLIEPARVGRIARAVIVFPFVVACEAIKQKRFYRAIVRVIPEVFKHVNGENT